MTKCTDSYLPISTSTFVGRGRERSPLIQVFASSRYALFQFLAPPLLSYLSLLHVSFSQEKKKWGGGGENSTGILDLTYLSSYLPLCLSFRCADCASLNCSPLVYSWTFSSLALISSVMLKPKMLALFLAETHKSGLSWLELTVGVGPAVAEIVCLLSSSSSMVFKKAFSVIARLLFIDGTHSSAICMQVRLFAPGIFPFLQTKLLAFLLSIYFRHIYF